MEEGTETFEGEITGIKFALATHQEVSKSSINECPIGHPSQLGNPFLGLPLENGRCESCGTAEPQKCEGHFGFIELPIPIYHPSHVVELRRMLSLLCLKCLKFKNNKLSTSSGVLEKLLSTCCEETSHITVKEHNTADGASFIQLKLPGRSKVPDGAWRFLEKYGYRYGEGSSRTLLPSEVLTILRKLPEETKKKLTKKGYFPQEGYILRLLPVPPNCLSVPDISDGVSVMSMDLASTMLKKVLRQIEIIKSTRSGEPNFEAQEVETNELQVAVSQYLQVRGAGTAAAEVGKRYGVNKEAGKTATKAWLDKMRTLFISKGSGFSSRSVITGEAYKNVDQIGLPSEIAQRMTFEERVNVHNINFLQSLVDQEMILAYRDGLQTYSLREGSKGHTFLRPGQVVHRRIMDGDVVFVNRPPTTHKHSLQALRVYVHEDHTVKINPLMCGPLAADFDGDCVHIFYPQSLAARAEVLELFSVEKQLLSSHTGNLNLQLSTDSLLSLKLMFKDYFLGKSSAQQLNMFAATQLPPPAVLKGHVSLPCWTALQVIQSTLPAQFDCYGDRHMIRKSEILKVDFNRDVMQSMLNEIVTSLVFEKGPKEALSFFDSLQPLLMENLFSEGFSVSLEDFMIPSSQLRDIQRQIQDISSLLFQLRSSYNELVERQMEGYLRRLKRPVVTFVLTSSALGSLIDSKSESSINKIAQQIGFLGQQLYDRGKFYSKDLVDDMAHLFHQKYPFRAEYPCEEYGLVKSAFFHGLDPFEEIVHSVATREVIIRSSRGLAEPGTLFKNLMAILRDVVICYDGTVRNVSSNYVIQFDYGVQGEKARSLFPAGEPVGVLAATAMSNPAYKAVLDSSPSSNSSWDMMKEILFCNITFKKDILDRRVILYLNDCDCGRKFCRENASCLVKKLLKKVSLRDAAVEFLIEYKSPTLASESYELDTGLVGHIHLSKALLNDSNITMHDILEKCQHEVASYRKKKQFASHFKGILLSVSESCPFNHGSKWSDMPCLKFFWQDVVDTDLNSRSHIMADVISPVLLDTVVKGDPRIAMVNIIWINPDTSTWIGNSSDRQIGELAVEVVLERKAINRSGDAWRIVLDCCLPVFHLIDTRRSIPYAVKQIEELLGISAAFDQAVQRLSTSVTMVTRGILKEHLLLLASSMTSAGTLIGFNKGGIKAMCQKLGVQVPFTEATLYTPRKCFERAAEKGHLDSLSSIVASCSWGKQVAVGTGAKFDILWNEEEATSQKASIDVYDFLQLVRGSHEEEDGCLGGDVDKFELEDEYMEGNMSPKDSNAVFEDAELELDKTDAWENSGWNSGTNKQDTDSAWNSQPIEPSSAGWNSQSGGWDTKKSNPEGSTAWGSAEVTPSAPASSGGWGSANDCGKSTVGTTADESASGWDRSGDWTSKKNVSQDSDAWGSKKGNPESSAAWGSAEVTPSAPASSGGWGSANDGGKSTVGTTADESASGWGRSGDWTSKKNVSQDSDAWGSKKGNPESSAAWGSAGVTPPAPVSSGGWGSANDGGKSTLGTTADEGASNRDQSVDWASKKNVSQASNAWGSMKSNPESSVGWGSAEVTPPAPASSGGWGSANDGGKSTLGTTADVGASEWDQSGDWASKKNVSQASNAWGSNKTSAPVGSQGWAVNEGNKSVLDAADEKDSSWKPGGWGSTKKDSQNSSSWGVSKKSPAVFCDEGEKFKHKNTAEASSGWNSESGGWESGKRKSENSSPWGSSRELPPQVSANESDKQSGWGFKNATSSNDNETGNPLDSQGWDDKAAGTQSGASAIWGQPSHSTPLDAAELSNKAEESHGWDSSKEGFGVKDGSVWGKAASRMGDAGGSGSGWASCNNPDEPPSSKAWQSKEAATSEGATLSDWGKPGGWSSPSEWKQSGTSQGWDAADNDDETEGQTPWGRAGGSTWKKKSSNAGRGSSDAGDWKGNRDRPARPPRSSDGSKSSLFTVTRQRLDLFTPEEQDILSELEPIMQSLRRIMHREGYTDGDPIPKEDQSFIFDNVLSYHPDKEAKLGCGLDYVMVSKHTTFQDSRCLYTVSTDGQKQDFSYRKCLENLVKTKYPDHAESFIPKYWRRPRNEVREQESAKDSPSQEQPPTPAA